MKQIAFILMTVILMMRAHAAPMTFQVLGNGGNCNGWEWVAAEGEITLDTPDAFRRFLAEQKFIGTIQFHSPGGVLTAGMELRSIIRANKLTTSVGRSVKSNDPFYDTVSGECASACAYAFMVGISRAVEKGSRIGVHRFYREAAVRDLTAKQFSGVDLDVTQIAAGMLALYIVEMGIDSNILVLANRAGFNSMYWLSSDELKKLKVEYNANDWTPWQLEPYRNGLVAYSKTLDARTQMTLACTRSSGLELILTFFDQDTTWLSQVATCPFDGMHPIFGARVPTTDFRVAKGTNGGASIRFKLPRNIPFTDALILGDNYPRSCALYLRPPMESLAQAGRLVARNCT